MKRNFSHTLLELQHQNLSGDSVKMSRALEIFLTSLKTESTKENYLFWLDRFLEHTKKETYDDLILDTPDRIQQTIENYVLELRRMRTTRAALKATVYSLFHFYSMNRIILNEKIIRKLLPEQETKIGGNAYSTKDVQKIILAIEQTKIKKHKNWHYTKPRAKALVHLIASSGVRLGAIPDLKLGDLKKIQDCYSVTVYANTRYEYVTFITPEASNALDEFLSVRKDSNSESNLFGLQYDAVRLLLYRLVKKAKVSTVTIQELTWYDREYKNRTNPRHRLDIPTVHGLRKRWNTIMKSNNDINDNLIEMMLGHTVIKLDENYLKPTVEKLFEEYSKGIEDLTIFKE